MRIRVLLPLLLVCLLLQVEQANGGKGGNNKQQQQNRNNKAAAVVGKTKTRGGGGGGGSDNRFKNLFTRGGSKPENKGKQRNVQQKQKGGLPVPNKKQQRKEEKQMAQAQANAKKQQQQWGQKAQKQQQVPLSPVAAAQQEGLDAEQQKLLVEQNKVETDTERVLFSPDVQQAERSNSRYKQLTGVVKVLKTFKFRLNKNSNNKKGATGAAAANACKSKLCQQQLEQQENIIQKNIDFVLSKTNSGKNNRRRRRRRKRTAEEQEKQCQKVEKQMGRKLVGSVWQWVKNAVNRITGGKPKAQDSRMSLLERYNQEGCLDRSFNQLEGGIDEEEEGVPPPRQPQLAQANMVRQPQQYQQMQYQQPQHAAPPSLGHPANGYYPPARAGRPASPPAYDDDFGARSTKRRPQPPGRRAKRTYKDNDADYWHYRRGGGNYRHPLDDEHPDDDDESEEKEEHDAKHQHSRGLEGSTEMESDDGEEWEEEEEAKHHKFADKGLKLNKKMKKRVSESISAEDGGGGDMDVENETKFDQFDKKKVKWDGTRVYERHTTSKNENHFHDSDESGSGSLEVKSKNYFDQYDKKLRRKYSKHGILGKHGRHGSHFYPHVPIPVAVPVPVAPLHDAGRLYTHAAVPYYDHELSDELFDDYHHYENGRHLSRWGGGHGGRLYGGPRHGTYHEKVLVMGPSVHTGYGVGANGMHYGMGPGAGAAAYGTTSAHQHVSIKTHAYKRRRGKWAAVLNVALVIGIIIVVLFLICCLL